MRLRDFISLVEQAMEEEPTQQPVYYHVTLTDNLKSIMERGLMPSVGERSKKIGEPAAVFLFPSEEDAETAVGSWLGDEVDEDEPLALLRVTVPPEIKVEQTQGADFDCWSRERIPPECIQIVDKNFGG
jgi:hypothetical protein